MAGVRKKTKKRKFNKLAVAGIVILTVALLVLWDLSPTVRTKKILASGRLANLPESTTDLNVGGWGGGFTGEDYIKFCATPEDINKFIAESPSVKAVTPEIFSSEHMYLPQSTDASQEMRVDFENYYKHKYYYESHYPSWFKPTIKVKGRIYEIPGDPNKNGHNWGFVSIDDETDTVYIYVIWS